ncbi:ankyrin repeats (3 copies) domain-containing protein [Trichoderma breve]|uniref:Ankyrin repeats (3 copies) domain-containing protein n=1 Tax=Trichoderma breve TaxID=2034170 RepID=A0A9W9B7X6_9HYPO|nr:ankyrin repeats (3 copies) domain-containing protein [Trichoderma breve]KAJ4855435.1 ankyrin repeats (3 copies) domain-containing protein [Trichoderma breve]
MGDVKQAKSSRLRSFFRRKKEPSSQENIHQSKNAIQNKEEPPIKGAQTTEQSDLTGSSQPPSLRPTSSVGDGPAESPDIAILGFDLWSRAYQALDEKSRKWILGTSELKPGTGKQWTADLITLVRERERSYKDSTPKLKIGDREIIWRDYANKTVMWLVTIGDIAVNFAPAPSPIIWSALKVFMKTHVAQCEDLVAIFGCAERVLSVMRRGTVYEIVYLQDAPPNNATEDLKDVLFNLYKVLFQLLTHALERLNEGQGRQFFHALISPGKGEELVSALSDHENKLSMVVQACGAIQLQEHQNLLQSLSAPLRRVDENVKNLIEHLQEKNLDEALDYISAIPIGKHHFEKRETRAPETCEWLLKHQRFLEWEESSCSSTLWLQGSIGAGKSYLTSKVIDRYVFDNEAQGKNDEGFAYFYCSRSDTARRDSKSVYQSYIRQLAQLNHYPTGMHKSISDLYRKAKKEQRELSITECKAALSELLKSYPRTTLVLDALDECEVGARKEIVLVLHSLATDAERPVKVYIASRREPDIERSLGSESLIEIGTSDNKGDIEKYIEQEMTRFDEEWESVSQGVREEVKRTITDQSDGMFRWAYLQWEQLKKFKTDQSILERLGKLPKSLEHAYDEIYSQNEGYELAILQRAVKWVLCAAEPLSNDVLLWAIRLETQTDSKVEAALTLSSPVTQSTLESICCNLVVRDSKLEVWKFPHASAAEYFEGRHKDWTGKAHEDVAILLISYLIDCYSEWRIPHWNDYLDLSLNVLDHGDYLNLEHPLQDYARRFWAWHARGASDYHQVSPILKRFLGAAGPQKSSSRQYQAWCKHINTRTGPENLDFRDLFPAEMSIFGICALGLHTLLEGWWDDSIDVSLINDEEMDLLSIAARYGHRSLCSDLVNHGSVINRPLESGLDSALAWALGRQQVETAAFLLDKGCNPDNYANYRSYLCIAAHEEQLVEMLLKAGADPNIQCRCCLYGCALEAAAGRGRVDSVRALIKHGADVNFTPTCSWEGFGSPLAAAAWEGSLDCVKLLLEHGASVNAQLNHGDYGSALATAAYKGWLECVKLLIEHGADTNAQLKHGKFGSALGAALFGWAEGIEIVKYLVEEAGADGSILSSCPGLPSIPSEVRTLERARYLVEGGYIQASILTDLGLEV